MCSLILYIRFVASHAGDGSSPLFMRIEELRHHLRIEQAVAEGARNAVKYLQQHEDKRSLLEVSFSDLRIKVVDDV